MGRTRRRYMYHMCAGPQVRLPFTRVPPSLIEAPNYLSEDIDTIRHSIREPQTRIASSLVPVSYMEASTN